MNTYTDTQLKQALAKMLPERVFWSTAFNQLEIASSDNEAYRKVLDTELLHLCWLVEETIKEHHAEYHDYLCDEPVYTFHATWQQRVIALAKVLNVEVV